MTTYCCTYLGAALLSLVATPLVGRLARARRLLDQPSARKVHRRAVPRIGGLAILVSTLVILGVVMATDSSVGRSVRQLQGPLGALLAGAVGVAAIGLVDDGRGLRARYKLLGQAVAAAGVCAAGIRIRALVVEDLFALDLGLASWPLTMLWIVGITNAVNLIDGLDGLAAGICAATCGVIAAFALTTGQVVMAVLMLALLGSLSGFLYFNVNPARVFLGDGGTYFLGFVLAGSSVLCAAKASTMVGLALPALALGVPIFDTLFSILRRFLERRSIFSPDSSHIHHTLVRMGLRQRHVVLFLHGVTLLAAGLGMFMLVTRHVGTLMVFGCVVLLLLLVFRVAGAVTLHESVRRLRRRWAASSLAGARRRQFEEAQLSLRAARSFEQWWRALCRAAAAMGIVSLRLSAGNGDGGPAELCWADEHAPPSGQRRLRADTVMPSHRPGRPRLEVTMESAVNGSLEAAADGLAYFCRLLDEHTFSGLAERVARAARAAEEAGSGGRDASQRRARPQRA